ncbi:ParB N-terminal domain-containing protein [Treponema endosymbiont of Eucomonympha sp.]|uniref:ParB N-terminal domain-containing protein n=1 Tax=Treponema endosymbiont of Eucomonympha sp. TaxID=1580831 RepID=UPI00078650B2|nr:ParB N-terminal domain-containing protein [Treponema endosymbiont of Eucomonympha sp.]
MLVRIADIAVRKRVRKDGGDLETLKDSLKRYGLLNPVTLNTKKELIAGGRRLAAAKQLGWTRIDAVIVDTADETAQLELELEENTQRLDFAEGDLLEGYRKLERLKHPNIFRRVLKALKRFFAWLASFFRRDKS